MFGGEPDEDEGLQKQKRTRVSVRDGCEKGREGTKERRTNSRRNGRGGREQEEERVDGSC